MNEPSRVDLHFESMVRGAFHFLEEIGFLEVEAGPTLLRYQRGDVEVDVYHGRQSYEVGAGVSAFGVRYALSEVIRASDPAAAQSYRRAVATTLAGVAMALDELSSLMRRYGSDAVKGDQQYFSALARQREQWSADYALDVLVDQLRPRAEEAFRQGNYVVAADLYARIKGRLTQLEAKKLAVAQSRCKN